MLTELDTLFPWYDSHIASCFIQSLRLDTSSFSVKIGLSHVPCSVLPHGTLFSVATRYTVLGRDIFISSCGDLCRRCWGLGGHSDRVLLSPY